MLISCNNSGEKDNSSIETSNDLTHLVNAEINVKGMTCEGCQRTVTNSIHSIDGIQKVNVSYIDGQAKVVFDSTLTNLTSISSAINKTGYEVTGYRIITPSDSIK